MTKTNKQQYVTTEEFEKIKKTVGKVDKIQDLDLRMHFILLAGAAVFGILELAKAFITFAGL